MGLRNRYVVCTFGSLTGARSGYTMLSLIRTNAGLMAGALSPWPPTLVLLIGCGTRTSLDWISDDALVDPFRETLADDLQPVETVDEPPFLPADPPLVISISVSSIEDDAEERLGGGASAFRVTSADLEFGMVTMRRLSGGFCAEIVLEGSFLNLVGATVDQRFQKPPSDPCNRMQQ